MGKLWFGECCKNHYTKKKRGRKHMLYFYVSQVSSLLPRHTSAPGCQTKGQKPADFQTASTRAQLGPNSNKLQVPKPYDQKRHLMGGKNPCSPNKKLRRTKIWQSPGFPAEAAAALVLPPPNPQLGSGLGAELLATSTPSPSSRSRRSANFTDIRTSNGAAWTC